MPDIPAALPDRAKVRRLIWERGYTVEGVARKIGRPRKTLYAITGNKSRPPKPVGVESILRPLAVALSTPKERIQVRDISDWPFDDPEPEPEALAS